MSATLSLLGMLQYAPELIQSTIFPLPTGLQHEILDPLLLAETAELEILYPEPDTLGTVIKAWASARGPAWARMMVALSAEYNPIHNYDRSETWTEERDGESSKEGSADRSTGSTTSSTGSNRRTTTGNSSTTRTIEGVSSSSSTTTGTDSASLTSDRAGYNSAAANAPKSKDISSGNSSTDIDGSQEDSRTEEGTQEDSRTETTTQQDSRTETGTQEDSWTEGGTNSESISRAGRISGNIGVTTSQQMIKAELELRRLDIYHVIVQEFKSMFCLGVY